MSGLGNLTGRKEKVLSVCRLVVYVLLGLIYGFAGVFLMWLGYLIATEWSNGLLSLGNMLLFVGVNMLLLGSDYTLCLIWMRFFNDRQAESLVAAVACVFFAALVTGTVASAPLIPNGEQIAFGLGLLAVLMSIGLFWMHKLTIVFMWIFSRIRNSVRINR